jgi:hypothetical protein
MSGRGDTDLYPELVWPMRFALADALHFRRVQGIDFGSALTLILRQHAPGEVQRPGEDFFELRIAVDASPDVADDAAQIKESQPPIRRNRKNNLQKTAAPPPNSGKNHYLERLNHPSRSTPWKYFTGDFFVSFQPAPSWWR